MRILKYGLVLQRLQKGDIELVRQWRNSERISQFMQYRQEISAKQQEQWFKSVDNIFNFYFIIKYQGERIGLINSKNVDWDQKCSEAGIFIWDEKYWETHVPILASLMLAEGGFDFFKHVKSYAQIIKTNTRAINFIEAIGYISEGNCKSGVQSFFLDKKSYDKALIKILPLINKFSNDAGAKIYLEKEDLRNGVSELFVGLHDQLSSKEKKKFELIAEY